MLPRVGADEIGWRLGGVEVASFEGRDVGGEDDFVGIIVGLPVVAAALLSAPFPSVVEFSYSAWHSSTEKQPWELSQKLDIKQYVSHVLIDSL